MMALTDNDGGKPEKRDEEDPGEQEEEEEDSFDSDDSTGEPQEIPQQIPRLNAVYNSIALHEKLEEIGWPDGIDWLQTLGVSYDQPGEIDVNDDLAREMAFYTQALEGTLEAYSKLQESGLPFLRPEDYYAEMVKSDTHMLKVKDLLLTQQKQYEEADARRKSREAKRFAKEVQAEKLKERAQQKKQNIDSVKKWRKMRQKNGFNAGEDDFPVDFEDEEPSSKKRRKLNPAYGDRRGGNSGEGLPRSKEGVAVGRRSPGNLSGSGRAFNAKVAPWDRSGGKNRVSFIGSKAGSEGGKAPRGWTGDKFDGFPVNFKGRKGVAKSRHLRNAKYGNGGKKGFKKQNTAESSAAGGGYKGRFKGNWGKR